MGKVGGAEKIATQHTTQASALTPAYLSKRTYLDRVYTYPRTYTHSHTFTGTRTRARLQAQGHKCKHTAHTGGVMICKHLTLSRGGLVDTHT